VTTPAARSRFFDQTLLRIQPPVKKLEFYAARGVEEDVDPQERTVSWMGLERGEYRHLKRSGLIELGAAELAEQIDWP